MIPDWHFASRHYDEALEILKRVCVIPSPSHNEDRRSEFILSWFRENGVEGAFIDRAKNVVVPYNDNGGLLDVFAAHTDVVFPDMEELPMKIYGDSLSCPGSGDDTANFVALMLYARQFFIDRPRTERGVLFVCNSCEEGLGNLYGVRTLMEDYGDRVRSFTSFDTVMGNGMVTNAVGSERYRVTVETSGGHSFTDFGKPNAIAILSSFITKLYGQKTNDQMTTYNVGTIEGGTSVNSIAQKAECTYEFRSASAASLDRMRSSFEHIVSLFRSRNILISTECLGMRPCGTDVDNGFLVSIAEAVFQRYGQSTAKAMASTDCNIPLSLGIPSLCFGLIYATGTHTREETVDLSSYHTGLDLGWDYIVEVVQKSSS